ncbi:MAG: Bax inhibitor-1/YccA family protein [Chloroflexi bacterium]|nr:Bax inhibitor-1/YccA family protein [Chloroflexota bacterium]
MYDYQRSYQEYGITTAQRGALMGKVLGLLGFAFLFTAGGAIIGRALGPAGMIISIIGSIGMLITLYFVKEKSPVNLVVMYAFATFEGMMLGLVLESYLARGLGAAVLNAAATTGVVTLAAGAYGYTTKRDLTGFGNVLTFGLIALVVASLIGFVMSFFMTMSFFFLILAGVSAVLFTGFLVYDLNQVAQATSATEGDAILFSVRIYLDIFNLFLALLQIFGFFSSSDD